MSVVISPNVDLRVAQSRLRIIPPEVLDLREKIERVFEELRIEGVVKIIPKKDSWFLRVELRGQAVDMDKLCELLDLIEAEIPEPSECPVGINL